MAFQRITAEEIAAKGVVAAPDKLTGKAAENKAVFDRLVKEIVTTAFNGFLDTLEGAAGAAGVGAAPFEHVPGTTVQGQIQDVQHNHEALQKPEGAAYVGAAPFGIVLGTTVQQQLRELLGLHEDLTRESGAAFVGAAPFYGVPSGTVQGQIQDVQKNISNLVDGVLPLDSVTEDKLAAGAVTGEKLRSGAVSTDKLAEQAVTADKLDRTAHSLIAMLRPCLPPWDEGLLFVAGKENCRSSGWQSVWFEQAFPGVPIVTACLEQMASSSVVGVAMLKNVTEQGFQWQALSAGTGGWASISSGVFLHFTAMYRRTDT